ncbi:TPA: LytR family transcriptional regulator, partial [Streptococcus pyogenes]|nr:LytR family transcriptional regulator [Streptococcus pyogenes]
LGSGKNGVEHVTIPENGDWVDEYDMYGGQALYIDFDKYQKMLAKLGLR